MEAMEAMETMEAMEVECFTTVHFVFQDTFNSFHVSVAAPCPARRCSSAVDLSAVRLAALQIQFDSTGRCSEGSFTSTEFHAGQRAVGSRP